MNFVIFPMFFLSTALYPLWKIEESGAQWIHALTRFNPFTHAIEALRFGMYGQIEPIALAVVATSTIVFYAIAVVGYDPQRGLIKSA